MEPVVAAANPEMGYGLSGVQLPPAVLSRVGVNIVLSPLCRRSPRSKMNGTTSKLAKADKGTQCTGQVASTQTPLWVPTTG
jgi:hypothetical protein